MGDLTLDEILRRTIALRLLQREIRGHGDEAQEDTRPPVQQRSYRVMRERVPRGPHPWRGAEAASHAEARGRR